MLPVILNGFAKQCTAMAKSTKQRCERLAAYNMPVCTSHGAHRKVISGKDSHFYKDGSETRQLRKRRPAKLKMLKQCEKALLSGQPITSLPFDDLEAQRLNKEFSEIREHVVKVVSARKNLNPVDNDYMLRELIVERLSPTIKKTKPVRKRTKP